MSASWSVKHGALRAVVWGATFEEAAVLFGCGERSVYRWVGEHGRMPQRERVARKSSLTIDEREQIVVGVARGESDRVIADRIGRHRSTVWREINNNGGRVQYRAQCRSGSG